MINYIFGPVEGLKEQAVLNNKCNNIFSETQTVKSSLSTKTPPTHYHRAYFPCFKEFLYERTMCVLAKMSAL